MNIFPIDMYVPVDYIIPYIIYAFVYFLAQLEIMHDISFLFLRRIGALQTLNKSDSDRLSRCGWRQEHRKHAIETHTRYTIIK